MSLKIFESRFYSCCVFKKSPQFSYSSSDMKVNALKLKLTVSSVKLVSFPFYWSTGVKGNCQNINELHCMGPCQALLNKM